jgi:hypothetical protein
MGWGLLINGDVTSVGDGIMACAILLPAGAVYFSILLHPVRLSKIYYICPMTQQERLDYVRHSYLLRIVLHMFFFICGLVILIPVSHFHAASFLLLFLNDLMVSALIPPEAQDETGVVYMVLLMPCYLILNLAQLVVLSDGESHLLALAVSYAVFFLLEVPMFVGYGKHIRRQLDAAASYERRNR